ncbi:hypothetical protein [Flexithrix dorotheae]|uniref:hypothetical protein n=1 Tax=Flexithrix dorotheae TaxID=70993 RepID=UPI000361D377|nr:hypothetical protein [Flexithrix dorotheae]
MAINGTKIATAIYSQRGFIFIFAYLVNFKAVYDKLSLSKVYQLIVKAGLISVALAILQRIYVTLGNSTGDMVAGLFSSDSQYLYFQCFCFIISISYWYHHKQLINKISPRNLSIIFILSIGIANNKAGIGFLLFILFLFALYIGYKNFWKFFGKFLVLGLVMGFSLMIFENILRGSGRLKDKGSYAYLTDPNYILGYLFGTDEKNKGILEKNGALRRGSALTFGYKLLKENSYTFYFGRGPGSTSESSIGTGELSNQYEGYKIGRSSLSEKLTEVGIIGTTFFIMTIFVLYFNRSREFPLFKEQVLIRKISVIFILIYLPYENMFLTILNGLIISVLLYPNIIDLKEEKLELVNQ